MASENKIDKVLNLYKQLTKHPNLTDARVLATAKNEINIKSYWSQRNLVRRCKQRFTQEFNLDSNLHLIHQTFPTDVSDELIFTCSNDEKYKAVLRQVKVDNTKKQFIEIWDKKHLVKSYDLSAYDLHGDIYTDAHFQTFHWSSDNTRLLYVSEKKSPKVEPFYKQKNPDKKPENGETPLRGAEYLYKPHWGEQLVGIHKSVVVILNVEDDTIKILSEIPSEYFPAQCIWAPNGEDVVGIAYKLDPDRYLGLYACTNRQSQLFLLKDTEFILLTKEGLHCRSPQFSPDGKHLLWLERDLNPAHRHCHRLMHVKWQAKEKIDILIDIVKTNILTTNKKDFYGLYNHFMPRQCWSKDSKFVFFSTSQRSNIKSYLLNIETKEIFEIQSEGDSSLTILDVGEKYVLFSKTNLLKPSHLVIGKFDPKSKDLGNLNLKIITNSLDVPGSANFKYEHNEVVYDDDQPINSFTYTYFGVKQANKKTVPLIVMSHGGPYASFDNTFIISNLLYANLGFATLQINFRGSTGMGADNIDYLLGKCGSADVQDSVTAVNHALKKYTWLDPNKVMLIGGSHGGFLSAHLSGQYPNMFRAAVLKNPVIDISLMLGSTDIPDWCFAGTGPPFSEKSMSSKAASKDTEILTNMYNHSPISYVDKVKAPTLICIGKNDLRVPPSQGRLWFNRLRANNVEAKLLVYDDNHSLSSDVNEIDHVINSAIWMLEKIEDKKDTGSKAGRSEVKNVKIVDQMPDL